MHLDGIDCTLDATRINILWQTTTSTPGTLDRHSFDETVRGAVDGLVETGEATDLNSPSTSAIAEELDAKLRAADARRKRLR